MIDRLKGVSPPAALLGVLLAVLTFPLAFGGVSIGLDGSWVTGLYLAVEDGLDFGTEVVYTYGPLGFLHAPALVSDGLAIVSFLYGTALWIALAIGLLAATRRNFGLAPAFLVVFVVLALFAAMEVSLVVAAVWSLLLLSGERSDGRLLAFAVGGGLLAAVEVLLKLSVGPVVLAILLLALIGARAGARHLGAFAGVFVVVTATVWLVTGGHLPDLVDYVLNSREIVSGYSEALILPNTPAWQLAAPAVAAVAVAVAAALGDFPDRRARIAAVLLVLAAGFASYKAGVVRSDPGHLEVAMASLVGLWLAVPWVPKLLPWRALAGAGLLVLVLVSLDMQADVNQDRLDPIANVDRAVDNVDIALSPERRDEIQAFSRAVMLGTYDLDDETLAELSGRTVSIDPWEISAAWAYDLDWYPVPIFQNYQAYTTELDELNAETLRDPDGPDRVLRENPVEMGEVEIETRGVDGHYSTWEAPAQSVATLCNFEPLHTTDRWQVLGRVPDRCGEERLVESVESSWGETVEVPRPARGEVILARIDGAGVSGLESLRTLLFRSSFRYATVNGTDTYRFVPGTATDGLPMAGDPAIVGRPPWDDAPQAETIQLTGRSGDLRYDFYAMSVDPTEQRAEIAGG